MITVRTATRADLAALHAVQSRWDEHWFGAAESDADELAEVFALVPDGQAHVALDGDVPVGLAWWWSTSGLVSVHPDAADPDAVRAALLDGTGIPLVQVLERDTVTRNALAARGWRHDHSSFELIRAVSDDWQLDEPRWPAGAELRPFADYDPHDVHELVYRRSAWLDVSGHADRPYDEWHSLMVAPASPDQLVLVTLDGDLAGVGLTRVFADRTGWVGQLAVARCATGRGLGRATLLEAMRRLRDAGVARLGLGVEAENAGALALYVGVGLGIDREWQTWLPAGGNEQPSGRVDIM